MSRSGHLVVCTDQEYELTVFQLHCIALLKAVIIPVLVFLSVLTMIILTFCLAFVGGYHIFCEWLVGMGALF